MKISNKAIVTVDEQTSVESRLNESKPLYPNPTTGIVHVISNEQLTMNNEQFTIRVYNMQGGLLKTVLGTQVDLSAYPAGMYILQINNDEWKKIIKN